MFAYVPSSSRLFWEPAAVLVAEPVVWVLVLVVVVVVLVLLLLLLLLRAADKEQ